MTFTKVLPGKIYFDGASSVGYKDSLMCVEHALSNIPMRFKQNKESSAYMIV